VCYESSDGTNTRRHAESNVDSSTCGESVSIKAVCALSSPFSYSVVLAGNILA